MIESDWDAFVTLCASVASKGELEPFFDCFLTPEEKSMMASRLIIFRELLKGERSQRDISAKFSVSIAKITRGSNALKRDKGLRNKFTQWLESIL